MNEQLSIKRTTGRDPDFEFLIRELDNELWNEMSEVQATYDQFNKVPDIDTVVLVYKEGVVIASGCFKKYRNDTVEIKRMFTVKEERGKGIAAIVLSELEKWAIELNYRYAILETGIKLLSAVKLYKKSGYTITENYDQYIGLEQSVCMKKELIEIEENLNSIGDSASSPLGDGGINWKSLPIEYFRFEEGFVEQNIRCIPMIVRFKMDNAGIKLKLVEWNKFSAMEKKELALRPIETIEEVNDYRNTLASLIYKYTGSAPDLLEVTTDPAWANLNSVPQLLIEKAKDFNWLITTNQWSVLTTLQRFALIKLCRPGHENKNFPKAMREFGIVNS